MVDTAITGMFGRNTNTQSASDTKKIDKSNAFADVMAKSMSSLLTISNGIKGSAQIKGSKTSIDNVFVKNEIKDDVKDKTDKKDILIESLNNINSDYRIPLYLFYYEGYSIKEIALQMGKSESAIKMRLSRGKLALKKEMEGVK